MNVMNTMTVLGNFVHLVIFSVPSFHISFGLSFEGIFLSYFFIGALINCTSFDDCHGSKSRRFICVIE